jgi:hypothetical protein
MTVHCTVERVKKNVLPSGENVGARSFAGPEISPGAKISGAGAETTGAAASCVDLARQEVAERVVKTRLMTKGREIGRAKRVLLPSPTIRVQPCVPGGVTDVYILESTISW